MTTKNEVISAFRRGDIRTDSDMFELANSLGLSEKAVRKIVFQEMASGTACASCANVGSRFYNLPAWPCSICVRRNSELKDMFESE